MYCFSTCLYTIYGPNIYSYVPNSLPLQHNVINSLTLLAKILLRYSTLNGFFKPSHRIILADGLRDIVISDTKIMEPLVGVALCSTRHFILVLKNNLVYMYYFLNAGLRCVGLTGVTKCASLEHLMLL